MTSRRWRDPRTMRTWEVTVTGVGYTAGAPMASRRRHAVCFDTTGTPRQGLLVDCCERAESLFADLQDQDLALCLEAARHGGLLWVDPRDRQLWWVGEGEGELEMRSASSTVRTPNVSGTPLEEMGDAELSELLDRGYVS